MCEKMFTRQGLGGHMSRAHPGESVEYKKKKETRSIRAIDLSLLRKAQDIYRVRTGQKTIKGTDMNRTKLNKIREEIKIWLNNGTNRDFEDFPIA
jgi:hypothetical protein